MITRRGAIAGGLDSERSHKASLTLPAVRAAITGAMPLVARFDTAASTRPVGGVGLKAR